MKSDSLGLARGLAFGAGAAALGYAGLVGWHRARYGKVDYVAEPGSDELLAFDRLGGACRDARP